MGAILPRLFHRSFWKYAYLFYIACKCACGFGVILLLFFPNCSHFFDLDLFQVPLVFRYLVGASPPRLFHWSFRNYAYLFYRASVAQLDAPSDWRPGGRGFNPRRGRQHSFVEIDHEIFSTVILSLPLIQEGQLSVSGERMCTILVNRIEG